MNINSIGNSIHFAAQNIDQSSNVDNIDKLGEKVIGVTNELPKDTFEVSNKKDGELSIREKQEKIQKAGSKAAAWSILFGVLGTAYYGLRSDKKVAEKFDLDQEKDKDLIKRIKKEQVIMTLPAAIGTCIFGVGQLLTGGVAYIINQNRNVDSIKVD